MLFTIVKNHFVNFILFPASFIFLVIIISISSQWIIIFPGIILATLILIILSIRMGLYKDIDTPHTITRWNETIEDAINEIHKLFSLATRQVIIVSGSLNRRLWGNSIILNDLKLFIHNNIDLKILIGVNLEVVENSSFYNFLRDNVIDSKIKLSMMPERPEVHFIIVDEAHVRLEKKHEPKTEERKALIKEYGASLAFRAQMKYEEMLVNAIPITSDNFNKIVFLHKKA